MSTIGVKFIDVLDGFVYFCIDGIFSYETAIAYVDEKIDDLPESKRPDLSYENLPSLKERWYLYDNS